MFEKINAANIKSGHTKLKVAAGYFFLLVIVFSLTYITYNSFRKIISSVESLSNNNKNESAIVKNIASGITEIRMSSKMYSITFKPSDFSRFIQEVKKVSGLIDSLEKDMEVKEDFNKVDSLNAIFKEYITSINYWLAIKAAGNSNDFKKITQVIKEEGDSLTHSPKNLPKSKTTTVTKIIEKPLAAGSSVKAEAKKNNSHKTFFEKLFGRKKKNEPPKPSQPTPIKQQITTETYTQVDTNYYNQVDLLLTKVKKTLASTEKNKHSRDIQLSKIEMKRLNYQAVLIAKINQLLKNIEQENQENIANKIILSKQTAEGASKNLLYVELFALITSLAFVYIIFSDITKSSYYKSMLEKAKLEAEKLAKAKEDFLANMSHEIRTPLTSIIGFSEQLENTSLKENQQQQVHSIVHSSEHLLSIVNDILDYSKIESGSLKYEQTGFSANDIIEEVIEIMRLNTNKKGLQIFYEPDAGMKNLLLSGDPFRLKQVLINLIGNSIKFTEKGYVRIESSITETDEGYLFKCNIKDTGIGIDKNKLNDIFIDFSQADNSITRKYGGTGLGLPISKKIVEMQNGTIWVESELQQGSVFSFEIPYLKASENEYNIKHHPLYEHGEELKDKKILLIDDDIMMPVLLEPILQNWQMNYTFCNQPSQAWNLLCDKTYDIIMLDIQMPGIDGFELIKRIKTHNESKNKKTKLLVCTANVLLDTSKLSNFILDVFVLYKPFKKAELWSALCKSMDIPVLAQQIFDTDKYTDTFSFYSLKNFKTYANEDTTTLKLFIQTFILQTKIELAEMENKFLQKNYIQVGEIAHKLKNTCGQLEAKEVIAILNILETLTSDNNPVLQKIKEQINALQNASSKLFSQLETELNHKSML